LQQIQIESCHPVKRLKKKKEEEEENSFCRLRIDEYLSIVVSSDITFVFVQCG
jgi:hypothetical protein